MTPRKNIMGTISFNHKFSGMRKEQEFIVYPLTADSDNTIMIQSDSRIGKIDLTNGSGKMSQAHASGAYGVHLSIDKLVPIELDHENLWILRNAIRGTASKEAGSGGVKCDNTGALFV